MNKVTPQIQRINGKEAKEIIKTASVEKWKDLALIGPSYFRPGVLSKREQSEIVNYDHVYQLTEPFYYSEDMIFSLINLRSLNLCCNSIGLKELRYIAKLTNLKSLNLEKNTISGKGVEQIANLTNLTSLNLSNNKINDNGLEYLEDLKNLTSLNVEKNFIGTSGIRHIAKLKKLTILSLAQNNVSDIGAKLIVNLEKLTFLDIGRATIPDLEQPKITDVGVKHLANLKKLTELYLYGVGGVSDTGAKHISKLKQLIKLNLGGNQISDKGLEYLANIENLNFLYLWGNKNIGNIGVKHISKLKQLTELSLQGTDISNVGVQTISKLNKLKTLYLGENSISNKGAKHLEKLEKLEFLMINNTKIHDLTPFKKLTKLRLLDFSSTYVVDLTPIFDLIEKGLPVKFDRTGTVEGIYVGGCPLTRPSPEVIKEGYEAILNYFSEIKTQGVDKIYEAKVLLVGEGRAGKTSLLRRLYQTKKKLPKENETTKGIEICHHNFQMENGRNFRLNVWDFAGQDIYHATHQFFLTKRSLYILLDDTASNHKTVNDSGFKYWLEVVELLSEKSPVLIFQNEKGGRSKKIDTLGIMGRFVNVKGFFKGNLEYLHAVDDIREHIQFLAQGLPHIGAEVPKKWVSIRSEIETLAKNKSYIKEEEYFDIYRSYLDFDREKARLLSRYLHDLGVFLHFQDHSLLCHTIILENNWATEAVFRILDHEQTKEYQGHFNQTDCAAIWNDSKYADMHAELLALMEQFELCYRIPDSKPTTWLAPQLFPPSIPKELSEWNTINDLVLNYHYEFLPKGIISRLIVRMHRYVKHPELAWTGGAMFEHEDNKLLIKTMQNGVDVMLRARGPERKSILSVIASDLDALNGTFKGLKVEKQVPCICPTCLISPEPKLFNEKNLLERRRNRQPTAECPQSYYNVSVMELLDGLKLKDFPAWGIRNDIKDNEENEYFEEKESGETSSQPQKTIEIFLASSKELKSDRDDFDLYFRRQNDWLREKGLYLKIVRWEYFNDAIYLKGKQSEYNEAIRTCDIFVSLFSTSAGEFTVKEFEVAHETFKKTKSRPKVYTFFKDSKARIIGADREATKSLWKFEDRLKELGHYYTEYKTIEELKLKFLDQLKILNDGDGGF